MQHVINQSTSLLASTKSTCFCEVEREKTQLKLSKQTPAKHGQLPLLASLADQISARTFVPTLGKAKQQNRFVYLCLPVVLLCVVLMFCIVHLFLASRMARPIPGHTTSFALLLGRSPRGLLLQTVDAAVALHSQFIKSLASVCVC